jgi:uncharacterized protein YrrD
MRLTQGADVYSSQGSQLGTLNRVILDPNTREVTHIVIERRFLSTEHKLVDMDKVNTAIEDRITLLPPEERFDEFTDFEEAQYVNLDATEYPEGNVNSSFWVPPMNYAWWRVTPHISHPGAPVYKVDTRDTLPEGTVALMKGAKVLSREEKHVGDIEELIVEPEDDRVTHFVIREGLLFKERKLVPVTWIAKIEEKEIHLSVNSGTLERLPEYQDED